MGQQADSLYFHLRPGVSGPAAVAADQRARLLDAMARAVVRKGYERTTVADVVERASVSRRTFYEQFADKEACFLAAYEALADALIADMADSVRAVPAGAWEDRLRAALVTYVDGLAADPELARLFLVDALGAGAKALQARRRVLGRFADQLKQLRAGAAEQDPRVAEVPDELLLGLVSGIDGLVAEHVQVHGAASLRRLAPALEDLAHAVLQRARTTDR
jgi:AcrR family transcriptional regulator